MKVVIYGAGGVGGYFGVRLHQAGHDVGFVARGANLEAITSRGFTLKSPLGDAATGPMRAAADPAALGTADVVFVTTKLYDLAEAGARLAPIVAAHTLVVPVQNGVEARDILIRALPPRAVLKATIYIASFFTAPGTLLHKSPFCRLRFAAARGQERPEVAALADTLNAAPGIEASVSPDIDADLWKKLIMLASFSAVAAPRRCPVGDVLGNPEAFAEFKAAIGETTAVVRAQGIALPDDVEATTVAQTRQFPADSKPSMLEDITQGRPLELEYLSGAVVRFGRAHGIATPVHEAAYRALAPLAGGTARRS